MSQETGIRNTAQIVSLDILRAIAAILVVVEHTRGLAFVAYGALPATQHSIMFKGFYLLGRLGQEAVLIFFVLSGFLVGGQVIRRMRDNRFDVRDYAIDRLARIVLPLAPAALLAGIVGRVWYALPLDPAQVAGNIAGLNGVVVTTLQFNAPLWSLAYEIWFYVIAGTVAVICAGRGNLACVVAAFAATLVFCRLDASLIMIWVLGALISAVEIRHRRGALAMIGVILLVIGSFAIQASRPSASLEPGGFVPIAVARGVFGVGFAMTLPWLITPELNRALARPRGVARSFSFLAGMSYTLYLFHYPLLGVLGAYAAPGKFSVHSIALFAGALATCFVWAVAMYYLFERNTDMVRRWAKNLPRRSRATNPT